MVGDEELPYTEETEELPTDEGSSSQLASSSSSQLPSSKSQSSSDSQDEDLHRSHKRREELSATLATHKTKRMKKSAPADSRLISLAEKELELKKTMMEQFETMNQDHKDTINVLTTNLKSLTETMTNTFALLQQTMLQRANSPHQYHQYGPSPLTPPPLTPPHPLSSGSTSTQKTRSKSTNNSSTSRDH